MGPLCTARSRCNCSWGMCLCSVVIGVVYKLENKKASGCVERRAVRLAHWQVGLLVLVLSYTTRLLTADPADPPESPVFQGMPTKYSPSTI